MFYPRLKDFCIFVAQIFVLIDILYQKFQDFVKY